MRSLTLSAALLSVAALTACGDNPQAAAPQGAMPPLPVGVASPIARSVPSERIITGRLEAAQTVELRSRVAGPVVEVLVADGAVVKANDLLLRIDPEPFKAVVARIDSDILRAQADVVRAEAEIARAESRLAQAQVQLDRAQALIAERIVAQQALDDASAAVRTITAEVSSAKAALVASKAAATAANAAREVARLDLDHCEIRAPIAGRISRIQTSIGNVVQATGMAPGTLIGTLVSDEVQAVFDVDESSWRLLATRLRASATANGTGSAAVPVAIALSGEAQFAHQGAVNFADNQIDTASGSIRLRARIEDPDRSLVSGAFVRVKLQTAAPRPVLLVHERAVLAQLATRYVYAVDDKGITSFRPVQLGEAVEGGLRVVEGGLTAGDRIAVNNLVKIFYPGMPVMPVPASMETLQNAPAPGAGAAPAAGKATP